MAERIAAADLQKYARMGAEARLRALDAERDDLLRMFPDLAHAYRDRVSARVSGAKPGRRRTMSAAARKAVSARMKKYWAARRAGKSSTAR